MPSVPDCLPCFYPVHAEQYDSDSRSLLWNRRDPTMAGRKSSTSCVRVSSPARRSLSSTARPVWRGKCSVIAVSRPDWRVRCSVIATPQPDSAVHHCLVGVRPEIFVVLLPCITAKHIWNHFANVQVRYYIYLKLWNLTLIMTVMGGSA